MSSALCDIIATLAELPTWEDKYEYVIELGRALPPMPEALKTEGALVRGCTSRVWMVAFFEGGREEGSEVGREEEKLNLMLDSDALIVRGLLALVHAAVAGQGRDAVRALDMDAALAGTGLLQHLSPNRRNGLGSVVSRVKGLGS